MKIRKNLSLAAALFCLSLYTASAASTNDLFVESLTYGGSGTPQGSVGLSVSDDRETFTMIFDSFIASTGPTTPVTESTKASQITINVSGGPGKALLSANLRGYVQLPAGATAVVTVTESTPDSSKLVVHKQGFTGPVAGDYLFQTSSKIKTKTQTSPVELKVEIHIQAAARLSAQCTVDSLDGALIDPHHGKDHDDGDNDGSDDDDGDGD